MKNPSKILFLFLLINYAITGAAGFPAELEALLPTPEQTGPWQRDGIPEFAASAESLYTLINGGADIYIEYGFEKALFQTYTTKSDQSFQLEIYQMKDQNAAFGMFSFKTGANGKTFGSDFEGYIEDYYINIWKGRFLITITALTMDGFTINSIIETAKHIAANIHEPSNKPGLPGFLPDDEYNQVKLKYIRGNLALSNEYNFEINNVFGVMEGVIGIYSESKIFLFSYPDDTTAKKWYLQGIESLKLSGQYHGFSDRDSFLFVQSNNGDLLFFKPVQNMILVGTGHNRTVIKHQLNYCIEKIEMD